MGRPLFLAGPLYLIDRCAVLRNHIKFENNEESLHFKNDSEQILIN